MQQPFLEEFPQNIIDRKVQNFRQRLKIETNIPKNTIYKFASTRNELEAAYSLTHEVYVKMGLCDPDPSGLRLSYWNAVPGAVTAICIEDNQVVSTVTLFPASELGLPMDVIYKKEVDILRGQGNILVEAGGLASKVKNQASIFHLFKLVILYAEINLKVDFIVNTIHPRSILFNLAVFDSKQIGNLKKHPTVKNNPAVAFSIDLKRMRESHFHGGQSIQIDKKVGRFFYETDNENFFLPDISDPLSPWSVENLDYFFNNRTNIYKKLDRSQLKFFKDHYQIDLFPKENFISDTSG